MKSMNHENAFPVFLRIAMKITPLFLAALLFSMPAMADINPVNGNFSITFSDAFSSEGENESQWLRTYNSQSNQRGWLGWGWGTQYEKRVVADSDDSLVLHDATQPSPEKYFSEKNNSMVIAVTEGQGDEVEEVFKAERVGKDFITRTSVGYARQMEHGRIERFDAKGRLIGLRSSFGDGFDIEYQNERPVRIVGQKGQSIELTWNSEGFLHRAQSEAHSVDYIQDAEGRLIRCIAQGKVCSYHYDGLNQLTRVQMANSSFFAMTYWDRSRGRIRSFVDPEGRHSEYDLETSAEDSSRFWTTLTRWYEGGSNAPQIHRYEHLQFTGRRGESRVELKAVQRLCSGYTALRANDTSYPGEAQVTHHPLSGKIIKVVTPKNVTDVRYTPRGQIQKVTIQTVTGQKIALHYSLQGQLVRMTPKASKDPSLVLSAIAAVKTLTDLQKNEQSWRT